MDQRKNLAQDNAASANRDGKKNKLPKKEQLERDSRTLFVGNVAHSATKQQITKLFSKCGEVEKLWIRGAVCAEGGKIPKKITIAKKMFEKNHPSLIAFVLFSTREGAVNGLQLNGAVLKDQHLRVTFANANSSVECSKDKSVFLGNLPFYVKDDELWELFSTCGEIDSVRVVRDSTTGIGKGFGYVNFKAESSVELALKLEGTQLGNRQIRISRNSLPKKKKMNSRLNRNPPVAIRKPIKSKPTTRKGGSFHGYSVKEGQKQKKKPTKVDYKRKELATKLTSKVKKPSAKEA